MKKYSDQCFKNLQVSSTGSSSSRAGTMTIYSSSTSAAEYVPVLENNKDRATLALRRNGSGYDLFIMLADVEKSGNKLHGVVYSPMSLPGDVYGNLHEDTLNWLQDKRKACPELK